MRRPTDSSKGLETCISMRKRKESTCKYKQRQARTVREDATSPHRHGQTQSPVCLSLNINILVRWREEGMRERERISCSPPAAECQLLKAKTASHLPTLLSLPLSLRLPPSLSSVHPHHPSISSFLFPPLLSMLLLCCLSSLHCHLPPPPLALW